MEYGGDRSGGSDMSDTDNKGTIERFEGWVITCPHCLLGRDVFDDGELSFQPDDGEVHCYVCENCGKEFEI